jgi:ketosteroid isomerase-like protein
MRWIALFALFAFASAPCLGQVKTKSKNGRTLVANKSKPVRRGIEEWYAQNIAAFRAKDVAALMALRTPDFHTVTPDGKTNDFEFMRERTKTFVSRIEAWISLKFEIGTIEVQGDLAWAHISQDTIRMQRFPDGTVRKVQAKAIQRETFRKTPEGWRLYKVDDIKDQGIWIDGVRAGG